MGYTKEQKREYNKKYYEENKEKMNEQSRKYRQEHKEQLREYSRKYHQNHRERGRQYKREYYQKLRRKAIECLGGKCVKCGITDIRVLQIDHVHGGGRKEFAKLTAYGIYRRVLKRPKDYQLLCANCNWIKRVENGEVK